MPNDPLDVEYFSVRRLSPFQGIMHITQTPQTRALSIDGINWQLQIRHSMPRPQRGSLDSIGLTERYLRYGVWTKRDGLSQLSIPPIKSIDVVQQEVSVILAALAHISSNTRFPLADLIELWLLDAKHRLPLALLASALSREKRGTIRTVEWIGFSAHDKKSTPPGSAESLSEQLRVPVEKLVNSTSGARAQAQWFERTASGAGIGLEGVRLDNDLGTRRLSAHQFPQLPLREDWSEQAHIKMVHDFHAWQAPTLLTLPNLSNKARYELEYFASKRPLILLSLHRLYPEVIQKELIAKALVEARIRKANAS